MEDVDTRGKHKGNNGMEWKSGGGKDPVAEAGGSALPVSNWKGLSTDCECENERQGEGQAGTRKDPKVGVWFG